MPARKKNSTQLRGAVNNIILESLYSGEKYGYEIIKEVEEKTNGKVKLKQPSLYSSLKRFESKNYIKSYWADSDIGGKRHYYSLTEDGLKYYKKNILKESDGNYDNIEEDEDDVIENDDNTQDNDDVIISNPHIYDNIENQDKQSDTSDNAETDDEYLEDKIGDDEEYEIDGEETSNDYSKYSYNVDDKVNELLGNNDHSEKDELLDELYENNDSDQVYTEEDLVQDQAEQELKEETPVDHEFRKPTPITDEIIKNEEEKEEAKPAGNKTETTYTIYDNSNNVYDDVTNIEDKVSDNALDDLLYHDQDEEDVSSTYIKNTTNISKNGTSAEVVKEEPKPQIYTDEYGITKMYYPDEEKKPANNKVFDNVVYRTNANTLFDKNKTESYNKNSHVDLDELSDEEREQRTTSFMQKFENRTKELTAQKESSTNKETYEKEAPQVDYKKVLTGLYDANEEYKPEGNYIADEEETYIPESQQQEEVVEDFEPAYTSNDDNKDYDIKIYTKEKTKTHNNKYLLVNKAKFAFGLTMLLFMLLQITIMLVVFKNKEVLMQKQYWVFQVAYVIVALVALYFCIPVFISPNKQATNTFKLGYMLMFGVLAFFVVVILSYAINTFMGMEIDTIRYYIPTLLVPIVLALNFVFGPIIYKIISQNRSLY